MEGTVMQHYVKRYNEDWANSKVKTDLIGKKRGKYVTITSEDDAVRYMKDCLAIGFKNVSAHVLDVSVVLTH
jgi:hypothetical protein